MGSISVFAIGRPGLSSTGLLSEGEVVDAEEDARPSRTSDLGVGVGRVRGRCRRLSTTSRPWGEEGKLRPDGGDGGEQARRRTNGQG